MTSYLLQYRTEAPTRPAASALVEADGSALTVAKNVDSLANLAGKVVGIPFWYSAHNLVVQLLLRNAHSSRSTRGNRTRLGRP